MKEEKIANKRAEIEREKIQQENATFSPKINSSKNIFVKSRLLGKKDSETTLMRFVKNQIQNNKDAEEKEMTFSPRFMTQSYQGRS